MLTRIDASTRHIQFRSLKSGARIAAVHAPQTRNASVVLGVAAGMRHEREGEEGMMHLLEHLIYQDSSTITGADRELQVLHAGGVLGGHTHMDYTEFYETAPVNQIDDMARRIADQVFYPRLREEQITTQVTAVATERASRLASAPGGVLPWPHLSAHCWQDHANSHDGSGDADLLGRATGGRLRELHARHYRTSNAVMVAFGPKEPADMLQSLQDALPTETPEAPAVPPAQESIFRTASRRTVTVPGLQRPRLLVATRSAPAPRVYSEILGDLLAAAMLSLPSGLDASAGMFGPGDRVHNDLFVLVDDTNSGIEPVERLAALRFCDDDLLLRAGQRALFTAEKLVHDDQRFARAVARDILLRDAPGFAAGLVQKLRDGLGDVPGLRAALQTSAKRLAAQQHHHLTLEPA
ncbi:peptidase M16 [Arthrobacter sp. MYb211]|uniref:M16 family metallopeptidase n=1 Tax=unclassified Arthrobacter TaxID=235627 RepID=UPI000CFB766B|nr:MULTISPECIES: insulinase family protein [unclassified Arthrobacter]PRA11072.1 peptidase M16 [Arthrobacter sp. MYb221]PRC07226.1 peptidase M16 [Arthrobacter sp. MYb211]